MKLISQNSALKRLSVVSKTFRNTIEATYETRAKNCLTCEVQGDCCTDAHFVNVHITRLEAVAMRDAINELDDSLRENVIKRTEEAVSSLNRAGDSFSKTYSCPLFEKGIGCLVHETAKPLPCINHACYENKEDLPPDQLLENGEKQIALLNKRTYGNGWNWLPIPEWLRKVLKVDRVLKVDKVGNSTKSHTSS